MVLEAGDLLFMYTDGLTETKAPGGDEDFGEDRLNAVLREQRAHPVDELFAAIHEHLRVFSGRKDADDDITMVGLKIAAADSAALLEAGGQ